MITKEGSTPSSLQAEISSYLKLDPNEFGDAAQIIAETQELIIEADPSIVMVFGATNGATSNEAESVDERVSRGIGWGELFKKEAEKVLEGKRDFSILAEVFEVTPEMLRAKLGFAFHTYRMGKIRLEGFCDILSKRETQREMWRREDLLEDFFKPLGLDEGDLEMIEGLSGHSWEAKDEVDGEDAIYIHGLAKFILYRRMLLEVSLAEEEAMSKPEETPSRKKAKDFEYLRTVKTTKAVRDPITGLWTWNPHVPEGKEDLKFEERQATTEAGECLHDMQIVMPNGETSQGVCKHCGVTRSYANYAERKSPAASKKKKVVSTRDPEEAELLDLEKETAVI